MLNEVFRNIFGEDWVARTRTGMIKALVFWGTCGKLGGINKEHVFWGGAVAKCKQHITQYITTVTFTLSFTNKANFLS